MSEELKVTSPEEYAKKAEQANATENAGFLHRLKKTAAVVRLRRVDMEALAIVGSLPMSLVQAATAKEEDVAEQEKKLKAKKKSKPTPDEVNEGVKVGIFIRQMVVENCLEPKIRHFEAQGVFFVNDAGKPISKVDKDDFMEMFAVISGQEGNDGLDSFRPNRKQRRASARQSGRKALQSEPVLATAEE